MNKNAPSKEMLACIKDCGDCAVKCTQCGTHCLHMGDTHASAEH